MSIGRRFRGRRASRRYGKGAVRPGYAFARKIDTAVNYTVVANGSIHMDISRRTFVQTSMIGAVAAAQTRGSGGNNVPASITSLTPLPNPPSPITDDERRGRIAKAQRLMTDRGIGAIVLEGGASMSYFVDVRWGLSERPFLLVIPARGEV